MSRFFFLLLLVSLHPKTSYGIDSIENILQTVDSLAPIREIYFIGNTKTNPGILQRELGFKKGDTLPIAQREVILKEAENRIRNTGLFTSVVLLIDQNNVVYVILQEQHYIWPIPIVKPADRNFNQWWLTKDPERIEYGVNLLWNNCSGRNDVFKLILTHGFTRQIGLAYSQPFMDKQKKWGLGLAFSTKQNREVWAFSEKDKLVFIRDENKKLITKTNAELNLTHRNGYYDKTSLGILWNTIHIADTILASSVNPQYLGNNARNLNIKGISLSHIYDKRDQRAYAMNGYLFKVVFSGYHYKTERDKRINFQVSGKFDFYHSLTSKLLWNNGTQFGWGSLQLPPYEHFHALGYENRFVRGYEYYVIDGNTYGLNRSNLKYILKAGKLKIKHAPTSFKKMDWKLLGGGFFDMGYVKTNFVFENNTLPNSLLIGYGWGLDFVAYYDRIIRLELSRNQFIEWGLFIHFLAPL
jgi:outer membrane protein assembly factor BamA